jgi:hypothetical protein
MAVITKAIIFISVKIFYSYLRLNSMQSKTKVGILLLILPALIFYACKKYKEPPTAVLDPRLTNHYCNDPRAVNYNWNFPGIADSTTCIYAVDSFVGSWTFYDTLFLPSGDTAGINIKHLTFISTEDTTRTRLAVTGWCNGNAPFYVTANNYGRIDVDTFPGGPFGQFLCDQTDTLNGYMLKNSDSTTNNRMQINFTINNAGGTVYHRGTAIKQ